MSSVAPRICGGLFVEQQMVVAEMRPADVPVEILGLQVQRVAVGQKPVEGLGNGRHVRRIEIGRGIERLRLAWSGS